MTKFRLLLTILACIALLQVQAQDKKKKTETACFSVSMSCHNCQAKIEKHIPWEKGVKDLTINLEEKTVCIVYDPNKASLEKLQQAIEALDFTCEIKNEEE